VRPNIIEPDAKADRATPKSVTMTLASKAAMKFQTSNVFA
jgi:hypothetical protein